MYTSSDHPHILAGDLNSLNISDYSPEMGRHCQGDHRNTQNSHCYQWIHYFVSTEPNPFIVIR